MKTLPWSQWCLCFLRGSIVVMDEFDNSVSGSHKVVAQARLKTIRDVAVAADPFNTFRNCLACAISYQQRTLIFSVYSGTLKNTL